MTPRKYRGLTKDGKWVEGWYVETEESHWIFPLLTNEDISVGLSFEENDPASCDCFEVLPESVGQSTGVKDKSKKEIYGSILINDKMSKGGDIVLHSDYKLGCVVTWNDKGFWQLWRNPSIHWQLWKTDAYLKVGHRKDLKVIGNVHQNPELLK